MKISDAHPDILYVEKHEDLHIVRTHRKGNGDIMNTDSIRELLESDAFLRMKYFTQHGETSTYTHSLAVAYYSHKLCKSLLRFGWKTDENSLVRGALLHDFFLYDWHNRSEKHRLHGFNHPMHALINAREFFPVNTVEADIIERHMWPLTLTKLPRHRETVIVCTVDKFCSLREIVGHKYSKPFVFEGI